MTIYQLGDLIPQIAESAYVAEEATLIGQVVLEPDVSVWPGAVIRADNEPVHIGRGSNIQEGAVLHVDPGCPLTIDEEVTVGHQAMLHGCRIGRGSLIGIQAVLLNNAEIGENSLVGAGAIVTEGKKFPPRSLVLGAPAKWVRELTEEEVIRLISNSENYVKRQHYYQEALKRIG